MAFVVLHPVIHNYLTQSNTLAKIGGPGKGNHKGYPYMETVAPAGDRCMAFVVLHPVIHNYLTQPNTI